MPQVDLGMPQVDLVWLSFQLDRSHGARKRERGGLAARSRNLGWRLFSETKPKLTDLHHPRARSQNGDRPDQAFRVWLGRTRLF